MKSVATADFFPLDLGFFCFIWDSGFFIENLFFLLGSNFRNVCCITVFSIQKYSSFTGEMGRVKLSSQYLEY